MFTDGAATSANTASPVFSSASYSFVAGDVGAYVFIGAGTNWTFGWYQIASVSAGAATLSAAVGAAVIEPTKGCRPSTVIGCATVASPTSATWSIDYSQQASAQFTYTDLASTGAGLTVSSAATPFAKQHVGNCLVVTGGTNFTAGRYVITSVAAGVATVAGPGNITTGAGANGTGGLGGALASLGKAGAHMVTLTQVYQKSGSYTITSASTNVAGGCISMPAGGVVEGYGTVRGDLNATSAIGSASRPVNTASGISSFQVTTSGSNYSVRNLVIDCAGLTSGRAVSAFQSLVYNVLAKNCTNSAFFSTFASTAMACAATGCSSAIPYQMSVCVDCEAYTNTVTPFSLGTNSTHIRCIARGNTGASTDGFAGSSNCATVVQCVSYGNGRDGFRLTGGHGLVSNCIAEGNSGAGYTISSNAITTVNNAGYNNTGGNVVTTSQTHCAQVGFVTLTASPFTNAASSDFSLNTTAGGGAACRAAGYPGTFPAGLTTGSLDIGAAQHRDPASLMLAAVE